LEVDDRDERSTVIFVFDISIHPFVMIVEELKKIFELEMSIKETVLNSIDVRLILLPSMDKLPRLYYK